MSYEEEEEEEEGEEEEKKEEKKIFLSPDSGSMLASYSMHTCVLVSQL